MAAARFYWRLPEKRLWPPAVGGLVLLLLLGALWAELAAKEDLGTIWAAFWQHLQSANWAWVAAALALMPANWLAETQKWHSFMQRYESLSLWKALLAVWVGVSFSLFTPNRIGEYGGRLLLVQPENRWKAVLFNVVGNYSQYLVLLTAGVWGLLQCAPRLWGTLPGWLPFFQWMAAPMLVFLYSTYFSLSHVPRVLGHLPLPAYWRRATAEWTVLQDLNIRELFELLAWAFIRYGIYCTQYFLLLRFFGITPGFTDAYAGIAFIFLIQTSLPLPPLAGLLARGNLALQVWSVFGANAAGSLAATFTLWIINLILPALIGTFSLFYVQSTKATEYEDISNSSA